MRYLALLLLLFSSHTAFAGFVLSNDQYGRSVSLATQNGQDVYTVAGNAGASFTASFAHGTPQAQAYQSINAHAPAGYVPPALPLCQQYTQQQYGQLLINNFTSGNVQRGMTPDQIFIMAQSLGPYFLLLQTGSLTTFLAKLGTIPVDGVVITNAVIAQFQGYVQAYLSSMGSC
jgi:hypothetical protein